MTLFRVLTLLSLCLLLTSLDAAPYFRFSAARLGHPHHDPHGWKQTLATHHSHFSAQPVLSHVTRLFANRNNFRDNGLQATLPNIADHQGLVGEQCSSDADCQDPRQCITIESGGAVSCTTDSIFCVCFSPSLTCSSEEDCDSGELCLEVPNSADTLCVSGGAIAGVNVSVTDTGSGTVSLGSEDSPLADGLNGVQCSSDSDCSGSRACLTLSGTESVPCSGQENCVCLVGDPTCSSNSDCETGEFCQPLDEESSVSICLAAFLVPGAQAASENTTTTSIENVEPIPSDDVVVITAGTDEIGPSEEKLNFESCQSSDECAGTRVCSLLGSLEECSGQPDCRCIPSESSLCTSDDECDEGEICKPLDSNSICVSSNAPLVGGTGSGMSTEEPELTTDELELTTDELELATDEPTATDEVSEGLTTAEVVPSSTPAIDGCQTNSDCADGEFCEEADGLLVCEPISTAEPEVSVCISSHHLARLSQEELLYSTHRVARVLCDENSSCATPGHIIKYKGVAMMMSSYCDVVGCTSKIDTVNSPKYYPGKVVESNSEGLEFTAHAARYKTKLEERMLSIAVRAGL